MQKFLNSDRKIFVFLIIILLPSYWSLFVPGFYGASDDVHIAWLYEMVKTIKIGQIPPRFVPDLSYGFGYPLFNFVFPLPFYLGSFFNLLGFTLVDSIKVVFLLSTIFSAYFMYLLIKEFAGRWIGLAGAVVYSVAPYRAVDLYIRGAIGEIVAFVFLPLITLSVIKLVLSLSKSINFKWIGIGALSLAGLILSHNITSYMFLPFLSLFLILTLLNFKEKVKKIVGVVLMMILGFLSSIYFWLPALLDSKLMRYDTVFNFSDHFPELKQLVVPYWGYGASVPGSGDGISFFLGFPGLFIFVVSFLIFLKHSVRPYMHWQLIYIWSLVSFGVSVFMMNYRSGLIWNSIPLLPYFQFPWRFLIMTTFMLPIMLIMANYYNESTKKRIAIIVIIISILTSFYYFRPEHFLGRYDNYYLNRYIPTPIASDSYRETQEEYLRLPKNTSIRPQSNFPRLISSKSGVVSINQINDLEAEIITSSSQDFSIEYNKYLFPGWYAQTKVMSLPIYSSSPYGQIKIPIPAGQHQIKIGFKETDFKLLVDLVSLISIILALTLITYRRTQIND